jgi:hypothetical protein
MEHVYLTKRDIDIARVLKQITKQEVKELMDILQRSKKSKKKVRNIILHNVA